MINKINLFIHSSIPPSVASVILKISRETAEERFLRLFHKTLKRHEGGGGGSVQKYRQMPRVLFARGSESN